MEVLDRQQARQIALRAQLLDAQRPQSLVSTVDQLTLVQIDPTTAITRSADLVAWSRLGAAYDRSDLVFALETERSLIEHVTFIRTMDDIGIHLSVADEWLHRNTVEWVAANTRLRERLLARLREEGPVSATDLPNDPEVPYTSTGWNDDKNTGRMLEVLCLRGEVAVSNMPCEMPQRHRAGLDLIELFHRRHDPNGAAVFQNQRVAVGEQGGFG